MVSIRAIESLHSLTNDIACIVDLAPSMAGGDSRASSDYFPPLGKDISDPPFNSKTDYNILFKEDSGDQSTGQRFKLGISYD